ncbi:MAG: plastocyanin/azurin family copper-binding protein [Gammaproteobacteria bacterium]|nr:plastocyanin/azurin family copper-binding protein [Gammaproteobacteria bacterium]
MKKYFYCLVLCLLLPAINTFASDAIVVVEIKNFKFSPQQITIKPGTTIHWINREKRQYHSVWFESSGEPEPDYFFPDESFYKTFNQTGTYPYRCGPHPKMTGVVKVAN